MRALGERTVQRVGGNQVINVDVRVIAATNKNLESLVEKGEFRDDLYFRLNVIRIEMPPLRSRKEDIVLLTEAFLREFAEENEKPYRELTADALQRLIDYDWPGNVRELRTAIEHGVVMSNGPKITLRHLPQFVKDATVGMVDSGKLRSLSLDVAGGVSQGDELNLDGMEQRYIRQALDRTNDNRTEAARLLGISRRTLQRKLKEMGELKNKAE